MVQKTEFTLKDITLAPLGEENIMWAEAHMPVLMKIKRRFEAEKPFAGLRIALCLHVTKETAVLTKVIVAGGAQVALCASNPLSTQDDVVAALAKAGIEVHAVRGCDNAGYYAQINRCLDIRPQMLVDDGADLVNMVHGKRSELLKDVVCGQEETTTGVIRLKAMARQGKLKFPVVAVNDTPTKRLFDNYYGTGQSTIDAVMRATNKMLAGSKFVVVGYGQCGKGLAIRAKGMGCRVIVVEVKPVEALRAAMDGYEVMTMDEAAAVGDMFVTVTGNKSVIRGRHFSAMKSGAIIANSGHFNVELCISDLEEMSTSKKEILPHVERYELKSGKSICLLAQGRLVNLAAGAGHPSEVMDMSFSDQALVLEYLARNGKSLKPGVHDVPEKIDLEVATLKAECMEIGVEKLTDEQIAYMNEYSEGT